MHSQLSHIFQPLAAAVANSDQAKQEVEALKIEAGKGNKADDGVMAKLVDGIVGLVPGAITAVVGAFATPLLGGVVGPVTKYVLQKLQSK